jgi:hypothetical protein
MVRLAEERHAPSRHDAAHLEIRKYDVGHSCEQRLFSTSLMKFSR